MLEVGGEYQWRREGPEHLFDPETVFRLQHSTRSGKYEIFADGFAGKDPLMRPNDAMYRADGVAVGPDGSLYISDSQKGRIWRVMYAAR